MEMDIGLVIYLCLMFIVSTLINVTVAGWLALRMAIYMHKRLWELETDRSKRQS